MSKTENYDLLKPDITDFYDVSVMNDNLDIIDTTLKNKADQAEVDNLKKSVSDGKTLVANAITGQGVTTSNDATFQTMATNITTVGTNKYNAGVTDTKKGTATASQVLSGYTFTNNSSVGVSGTIPSKGATTYTPGDSAQTISSGQYLSGVQTISAVPTETKTVTAGTSATTVSRTSGKYMTSVTVNPTPSQTKSVTMTSSPMTIYPDTGNLLSSVTVSANMNGKYATGTSYTSSVSPCTFYYFIRAIAQTQSRTDYVPVVTLSLSFTPKIFRATFYTLGTTKHDVLFSIGEDYGVADTYDSYYLWWFTSSVSSTTSIYLPVIGSGYSNVSNLTWEVWG